MTSDIPRSLLTEIISCEQCPRLRAHCRQIAVEKRRAFMNEEYWGRPVPGFGDPDARLIIIGLAPAAHGANRTGRMFTGDNSGLWLYRALHKAGFANQARSEHANDGLKLSDAYITAAARCAPPDNKPTREELQACRRFLFQELNLLKNKKVYLALGKIALDTLWDILKERNETGGLRRPEFKHGLELQLETGMRILGSYHPSQQNTFTKKLTEPMFDEIFEKAKIAVS